MSKTEQRTISEYLSEFCKFCDDMEQAYNYNYDAVNRLDKMTQDFLHILELKTRNYKERAKIATQLAQCRQERRDVKDFLEDVDSLIKFLRSDKGIACMKALRQVVGSTRKAEEYHKTREYKFRILSDEYDKQ